MSLTQPTTHQSSANVGLLAPLAERRCAWALSVLAGLACAAISSAQIDDPPTTTEAQPELFEQLWTAASGGKVHLNNRLRFEAVDQDGKDDAAAFTNRLRLGYTSDDWRGFHFMVEFENLLAPFPNEYFVPGVQGDPSKAVVADPRGTEFNQGYVDYTNKDWNLHTRLGRQRIILDNHRFVGNVGWRQLEQTFDAVRFDSSLGVENLDASYIYVWGVQRIFGPNGTNFQSDSHLANVSYTFNEWIKAVGFAYLLDFDNSAANSTQTFGLRVVGSHKFDPDSNVKLDYNATIATQQDYADNPTSYEALYFDLNASVTKKGLGTLGAEYELLGSDNGTTAFRTPLATLHAFNGWADVFLGTPANGLQDISVYAAAELPWEVKGKIVFHKFIEDEGGDDLGQEVDIVLKKRIKPNWSVTAKAAVFEGDKGIADRSKLWLQTTITF
jgi:Alginate export